MMMKRRSYPRFRRDGGAPAIELTDDDLAVLRYVHRHRFLRADDIYRLLPHRSHDKLSRRLTWLFRNAYLDRPPAQIDRFTIGGSRAFVYGLATAGARVLKERLNLAVAETDWKSRNRTFTRENLDHTLATAAFLIAVELACRTRSDVESIPFDQILAGAPEYTRTAVYPGRWPVPLQWGTGKVDVQLAPDAIIGLRVQRDDEPTRLSYLFVEIDRGTMTIAPSRRTTEGDAFLYRSSLLRKFLAYATSWRLGLHREHLGIPTARTLFLTTSNARTDAMRLAAMRHVVTPQGLPPGLFLFGQQPDMGDPLIAPLVNTLGAPTPLIGG